MQLDNSVKYQRIGNKFLKGIIQLIILTIVCMLFQYLINENLDIKSAVISFGGFMFIVLTIAILNETIDYNQKYYEILSNENYLKVKQTDVVEIEIKDKNILLGNIERQILESQRNWLLSKKDENSLEFQTKKKSLINYLIEDRIIIKIKNPGKVTIESAPINKLIFLDSSRNLGNILFAKKEIKNAVASIGSNDKTP